MSEIIQTISRVRRAMPRNKDVMDVCDEAEKLMARLSQINKPIIVFPAKGNYEVKISTVPKLTRAQIQKRYRQRQKAKK